MKQDIAFNPAIAGNVHNFCLDNVRRGFGIDNKYGSAWEAWEHTEQHPDRNLPDGLDIPLYYSYTATIDGVTQNYGHINVRLKDGTVWSDGTIYANIDAYLYNHFPQYVGWGESVNDFQIIEGEDMAEIFNDGDRQNANVWLYGEDLGLHSNQIGKTYKDGMAGIFTSPEYISTHTINDGDITNLNDMIFLKDLGLFKSQAGKVWKSGIYSLLMSDEYKFQNQANDGDIQNMAAIPNIANSKGKLWKEVVYQDILPNLPAPAPAPVFPELHTPPVVVPAEAKLPNWLQFLVNLINKKG